GNCSDIRPGESRAALETNGRLKSALQPRQLFRHSSWRIACRSGNEWPIEIGPATAATVPTFVVANRVPLWKRMAD
ncbi:MAG: hypothetical protein AB7P42_12275, partial [Gammaproteobacteria bacterium]